MKFDKLNEKYLEWVNAKTLDSELSTLLASASDEELTAAFGLQLEFGTAGIRGILGPGPGRFNVYTIKKVTISYAKLLISKYPDSLNRGVVIGHDNRHNSTKFAQLAAEILTSFGIKAYLFKGNKMKPTPVVSFATKDLNAIGGIVITASHNPANYNGYKIYDEFGCQLTDEDTSVIAETIAATEDILNWEYKIDETLLATVGKKTLDNYKTMIANLQFYPDQSRDGFKMIYSAVNGTGTEFTPPLLRKFGYEVIEVEEHAFEDATFKNVVNPNPEFDPAWKIPFEYGKKHPDAAIMILQDPDADRIGCAINHKGKWIRLDGNQTGPILIEWKLSQMKKTDSIPENPALYSSFVTSDLGDRIASETYGVKVIKTLTGFKWMGSEILKEPQRGLNFVFAYEESYGYVIDASTKDKDGIQATTMLVEAAWYYAQQGKTLIDVLNEIFAKYGYYYTYTENLNFKPEEIKSKVEPIMEKLRDDSFSRFGDLELKYAEDYIDGLYNMPGQNLMKFYFTDGSWFAVRPSGTEPKIKIYFVTVGKDEKTAKAKCDTLFAELKEFLGL
ncbi:phosphoglucomutase/phosphomannomutase [Spiroplasma clarkii]|uniref:Phosphoglucomutase/phosphomannomutase n=1 Tax=Spiroplasma clarkii TaxID=2139 RepID=A0A1Y0L1V9_9MOLU|nr:phospho-sugar mutase [Spiroplasma clarkii]ARU92002.1 phosphoglucomutase/phosphomannomutase [Spiroplasma clarkii]ATX71335.1 phosphoglucomutase/phosphomannomutase [Spiroplasma clarkii]